MLILIALFSFGQSHAQELSGPLKGKIETLAAMFHGIEDTRKSTLDQIAWKLAQLYGEDTEVQVLLIDQGNTLASQLGQAWLQASAYYFQIADLEVASAGIDPTQILPQVSDILKSWSFKVKSAKQSDSNKVVVDYGSGNWELFAKSYSEKVNAEGKEVIVVLDEESAVELKDKLTSKMQIPLTFNGVTNTQNTSGDPADYKRLNDEIAKNMVYLGYRLKLNLLELKKI